jgi:hypothetical protein
LERFEDLADDRLLNGCIYCGAVDDLDAEHTPSRVLLDRPLPSFPPKVFACVPCNRGFSLDEEYFAALIGCALAGSTDPDQQLIVGVRRILAHSPRLRQRIEQAHTVENGIAHFQPETSRVVRILHKLAIGHAGYELSKSMRGKPCRITCRPLSSLRVEERATWEEPEAVDVWGEIGSRAIQRIVILQTKLTNAAGEDLSFGVALNDWVTVQDDVYRYHVTESEHLVRVRMIMREYLACEVIWEDTPSLD